jgi:multidrug resistance efflux pump
MTDLLDPKLDTRSPVAVPEPVSRSGSFKKWRARILVVAMVAAAVYGGVRIAGAQSVDATRVGLGPVTLTAQGVPVETVTTGQVTSVLVHAQQQVKAGQKLATLRTSKITAAGETVHGSVDVTAPIPGVVSDAPLPVGTVLQTGAPFVVLYDPADLTLVANLPLSRLSSVSPGMVATLQADGLPRPIFAVVQRVVPHVGNGDPSVPADQVKLVLVPKSQAEVADLVPGLRFAGSLDEVSGTRHPAGGSLYVSH